MNMNIFYIVKVDEILLLDLKWWQFYININNTISSKIYYVQAPSVIEVEHYITKYYNEGDRMNINYSIKSIKMSPDQWMLSRKCSMFESLNQ